MYLIVEAGTYIDGATGKRYGPGVHDLSGVEQGDAVAARANASGLDWIFATKEKPRSASVATTQIDLLNRLNPAASRPVTVQQANQLGAEMIKAELAERIGGLVGEDLTANIILTEENIGAAGGLKGHEVLGPVSSLRDAEERTAGMLSTLDLAGGSQARVDAAAQRGSARVPRATGPSDIGHDTALSAGERAAGAKPHEPDEDLAEQALTLAEPDAGEDAAPATDQIPAGPAPVTQDQTGADLPTPPPAPKAKARSRRKSTGRRKSPARKSSGRKSGSK